MVEVKTERPSQPRFLFTLWPICKESLIAISTDAADKDSFDQVTLAICITKPFTIT
jgi:hypothetical protein